MEDPRITAYKQAALKMGHSPQDIDAYVNAVILPKIQTSQQNVLQEKLATQKTTLDLQDMLKSPEEKAQDKVREEIAKQTAMQSAGVDDATVKAKAEGKADEEKKKRKNEGYAASAKAVLDIIDAGEKGKLKGKAYQDALNFASGKWAESTFDTGGKQLTEAEIAILQGTRPTIQVRNANIIQRALGIVPPQTGKVVDDTDTLKRKAKAAIEFAKGTQVTPEMLSALQETQAPEGPSFVKNAQVDAKDVLNNVLNLPKNVMDYQAQSISQGRPGLLDVGNLAGMVGSGVLKEGNELLGRPLEGGDVVGRIMDRAYKKPVTTAIDLIPLLKLRGGNKGAIIEEGAATSKKPNALQKIGIDMRSKVSKPRVKADPYYARNVEDLVKTQSELRLSGNAEAQLKQLPSRMDDINTQITNKIQGSKVDPKTIKTSIEPWVEKVDYLGEETTFKKEVAKLSARIDKVGGDGPALYKLKSDLAGEMDTVFKKLDKGADLTPKEAAKLAYWNGLKDSIDTISTEIKKLNTLQNKAYRLSPGLVAQESKGGIQLPFLGRVGGPQIQSGQDLLGRILQKQSLPF